MKNLKFINQFFFQGITVNYHFRIHIPLKWGLVHTHFIHILFHAIYPYLLQYPLPPCPSMLIAFFLICSSFLFINYKVFFSRRKSVYWKQSLPNYQRALRSHADLYKSLGNPLKALPRWIAIFNRRADNI